MRLLLVSWYFPPANTIAAVRIGRLAKFLVEQGHDVRVISARDLPHPATLQVEVPGELVTYTPWMDVNAFPRALAHRLKRRSVKGGVSAPRATPIGQADQSSHGNAPLYKKVLRALAVFYQNAVNFPDPQIGWLPGGIWGGLRVVRAWRPDIVFASGPPFTTLLIGYALSRRLSVPWVIELRDRWSDDPYYPPPRWRQRLEGWLEKRMIRSAVGLSTVSEPWAETYRRRFGKPTTVVYNGFDSDLLDRFEQPPAQEQDRKLRIVYTGGIYPGRRDPTPLFKAIGLLGERGRDIEVAFYGTDPNMVRPLAEPEGVTSNVRVFDPVTHNESVAIQRAADVLLLMQWDDPREQGNVPGKFFEYLGARRPILVLGLAEGVPATIVRDRAAGCHGASPEAIAEQLARWLDEKAALGHIPDLPLESREGYARQDQYAKLTSFLEERIEEVPRGPAR